VFTNPNITFGAIQVFTISAVPEPGSYGLMLVGLGVMGLVLRRKRSLR